jgi:hemoglobin
MNLVRWTIPNFELEPAGERMRRIVNRVAGIAGIVVLCAAGGGCRGGNTAAGSSLYDRLGGGVAIHSIMDEFLDIVAADVRINKFFVDADLSVVRNGLANLVGQATGGPEHYTGKDKKTVHAGMGIGSADFDALVQDLGKALDAHDVRKREKAELLALLEGMKGDIVEK